MRRGRHRARMPGPAVAVRRYQERLRGQRQARQPYAGGRMRRGSCATPGCSSSSYDGDERMAVHDLRKHIAWYLKGFPVGGTTRRRSWSARTSRRGARDLASRSRHHLPRTGEGQAARPCSLCKKKKCICRTVGSTLGSPRTRSARRCSATIRWTPDTETASGSWAECGMVCRFVQMRWKNVDTRRENSFIINGSAIELCVTVSDRRQW